MIYDSINSQVYTVKMIKMATTLNEWINCVVFMQNVAKAGAWATSPYEKKGNKGYLC